MVIRGAVVVISFMASRKENERAFKNWEELPESGRRYWRERPGGDFGWCRYVKVVDADDQTISFIQEIYDDDGKLIEIHQKYPVDSGHRYLTQGDKEDDASENP